MTRCPLCGAKLLETLYYAEFNHSYHKTCALRNATMTLDYWRRLARQVKRLTRDKRKPSECRWHRDNNSMGCRIQEEYIRACPCAAWRRK